MPSLTCGGPACSGRPFSNKYQLNYHVLNSPLHFHCKPCKKAFKDEVAYKQHRKSSREHSPYCDLCDARFVTYEDLEHHFKSAQRHQNCKQCKVGFYDTAMLTAHRVYAHPKIACAQCPELGQKFQDEDLHKHYFSSAKHPSCITCRIGFADGAAYAEHQMDVHLSDAATPPIVQIEQTRIVSPTPSGSLNEASNRGEENVLCPGPACKSRKFSSEAALVQHLNTSQAHIQCCGRGFKLEMHYFQHRNMSPDHQSICILCNQNFATYEALDAHFQSSTNHPNCDRCLKGFASEAILRVHKICSHPAEICPQCPQLGPIYKEDLPEHYMQVEKHPKCKSCNLAFENDTVYEQHRSTEHDPSVDDEKVHETVINLACTDTVNERDWQSPDSQDLFLSCLQKAKTTANSVDVNESPAALSIRDTARQHVLSTYLTQTPQEGIVNIPMPCGEGKLIQLEIKVVDTIDAIAADKGCGKESSMAEDDATSLSAVVDSAARASVGVANPPDEGGPTARHVDGRREEVILDLDYNPWE